MNIFNFFFKQKFSTGAISDTRTPEQTANAYDSRELVGDAPVLWIEKSIWKTYPVKQQYYTGQCVAESTSKHLGINSEKEHGLYTDLSPEFFYSYRINRPGAGMVWLDSMKIAVSKGSCRDYRLQQRYRDSDPESIVTSEMIDEALEYRGQDFFEDKERSLDSIARIIDKQGSCLLWFWFDWGGKEWWKVEPSILFPNLRTYDNGATRHALCAVDYGVRNGKKVIKIEDSAGNHSALNNQDRFIDESFLRRCFVSGFVIDKPSDTPIDKPKWTGTRNLTISNRGDDVKELQEILRYEKLFSYPVSTGYYGGLTRASVISLQNKYANEILLPVGLIKGTGVVGPSTRAWLTKNYE